MNDIAPYVGKDAWVMCDWRDDHGAIHIIPTHDTAEHTVPDCVCGPGVQHYEHADIVIHNSFDGRESLEGVKIGQA